MNANSCTVDRAKFRYGPVIPRVAEPEGCPWKRPNARNWFSVAKAFHSWLPGVITCTPGGLQVGVLMGRRHVALARAGADTWPWIAIRDVSLLLRY